MHLILQPTYEEVFEPDAVADAPLVRFVAYTRQERVFGWVRLREDRLTDLLNAHEELHLTDAQLENLEDRATRSVDEMLIRVKELIAVHASWPRGVEALRRRTRTHAVALQSGNYRIGGHLHATPGVAPLEDLDTRPAMVPLTDAWIEYWSSGHGTEQATGTIIVNRLLADVVRVVTDDDLSEDELGPPT